MPITELAHLTLLPPSTLTPPLKSTLRHAKSLMQSHTSFPFHYFQSLTCPSSIYILGTWDSLAQHVEEFIPSEGNQGVLRALEGRVRVESLVHLGVDIAGLGIAGGGEERAKALRGERVWSLQRFFVRGTRGVQGVLVGYVDALRVGFTEGVVGGGWRVDREMGEDGVEKEEFVVFAPWRGEGQFEEVVGRQAVGEFERLREIVDGVESVLVRLLDI